ncbi:hypothetical protein ACP4OV_007988 [Aristida adscensionis]
MGRSSVPPAGSRYGRVWGELLDMGARVAVRSYTHCPQTARMYYKPPPTPAAGDAKEEGSAAASPPRSSSPAGGGQEKAGDAGRKQQQAAFEASEFVLYGR